MGKSKYFGQKSHAFLQEMFFCFFDCLFATSYKVLQNLRQRPPKESEKDRLGVFFSTLADMGKERKR